MSTDSFRDFVLAQLGALDNFRCKRLLGGHGLHADAVFFGILADFKANPGTLPDCMARNVVGFAPSKKRSLKNYREVHVDIRKDGAQLTTLAQKAAHP